MPFPTEVAVLKLEKSVTLSEIVKLVRGGGTLVAFRGTNTFYYVLFPM